MKKSLSDKIALPVSLLSDIRQIIESGKQMAYSAINVSMITTYWNIGRRIVTEEQLYLIIPNFEIWKSRFPNLTWTHIYRSLRVGDETAIRWSLDCIAGSITVTDVSVTQY